MTFVVKTADGLSLGVAEFGDPSGTPVLWSHGAPGSRLEPAWLHDAAAAAAIRIVAVDRPGYGRSSPRPGRTMLDGAGDLLCVASALSIDRFAAVGVSTGGAYALAVAATAHRRLLGVIACCAMTDMSWSPARATMSPAHTHAVWDAPDRDAAIVAATDAHGVGGSKMLDGGLAAALAESDRRLFADPKWMAEAMKGFPQMFTFGLEGFADDRIADGRGWHEFDVSRIRCPVTVLHGTEDRVVDPIHAERTASLVPGARLELVDGLGHFSIEERIVPELSRLVPGAGTEPSS